MSGNGPEPIGRGGPGRSADREEASAKHVLLTWIPVGLLMVGAIVATAAVTDREALASTLTMGALVIALLALGCEYVDSTLGMGYGTALTPLLLFAGYEPLEVVPAVLLSELATGIMAALLHHKAGNVDFRRDGVDIKIAMVLASCSVIGTLGAVFVAIKLPKFYLKLYIGLLVLVMGLIILLLKGRQGRFSWKKVVGLGVLASFNKGMSGGGYGPVVTCGQILSGITGKRAVGITSLAEGLTCLVGIAAFCLATGWPNWGLAVPLVVGGLCSAPLAAWSVSKVRTGKLTVAIGVATVLLGALTLSKVVWDLTKG